MRTLTFAHEHSVAYSLAGDVIVIHKKFDQMLRKWMNIQGLV